MNTPEKKEVKQNILSKITVPMLSVMSYIKEVHFNQTV